MGSKDKSGDQILGANSKEGGDKAAEKGADKPSMKKHEEVEREQIRKRERKSLMKSLQLAQMSTASMGKFDKKATKTEVNLNKNINKKTKSQKQKLSKIESQLGRNNVEKDRNLKILGLLQKEKDSKANK